MIEKINKMINKITVYMLFFVDISFFIISISMILDTSEKVVLGITMMITIAGLLSLICSYPKCQKYIKEHYLIFNKLSHRSNSKYAESNRIHSSITRCISYCK